MVAGLINDEDVVADRNFATLRRSNYWRLVNLMESKTVAGVFPDKIAGFILGLKVWEGRLLRRWNMIFKNVNLHN